MTERRTTIIEREQSRASIATHAHNRNDTTQAERYNYTERKGQDMQRTQNIASTNTTITRPYTY